MSADINYSLFVANTIKASVEAIEARPKISRVEFIELRHKKEILSARFEEVSTIMQPLEASYITARRKLDPANYNQNNDKTLQIVNAAGSDRHERLLNELEPLHETWKRVVAARNSRAYLIAVLNEVMKLITIMQHSEDMEELEYVHRKKINPGVNE